MGGVIAEGGLGTPHPKARTFPGSSPSRRESVGGTPLISGALGQEIPPRIPLSPFTSFHMAAASNSPRATCARGVCAPHFRPPLTPGPTLVTSEPLCSVIRSVIYVSLYSLWRLSALFPPSSATYTSYIRLPRNLVKNSPRGLWTFSLEGKAWLPGLLSKMVRTLPYLWCRNFRKCFVCSLVCLVFLVLPGEFVILRSFLPPSSPR